jgi:hypothetical protein
MSISLGAGKNSPLDALIPSPAASLEERQKIECLRQMPRPGFAAGRAIEGHYVIGARH